MSAQGQGRQRRDRVDTAVVHEYVGYTTKGWAVAIWKLLAILTGGLTWVIARYSPRSYLWTLRRCPLSKATHVHVKLINGRRQVVQIRDIPLHHESPSCIQQGRSWGCTLPPIRVIYLLLVAYVYNPDLDTFEKLPEMPINLPLQIHNACKALHLIDQGADWTILNPPSTWQRWEVAQLYGRNDMATGRPNLFKMAEDVFLYPVHVIQYYELAYKFYERFYLLAACLLYITIQSAFLSTIMLYRKRTQLFQTLSQKRLVPIVHLGRVRAVSSNWLVPGDVIVVLAGRATCDMVLLQGNCLVEESMLSGEAAQVRKSSFVTHEEESKGAYHPDTHHSCTIHAGTVVLQVWADDDADDEVLAMVVRTGLRTSMGSMLQQIVAPLNDLGYACDPFIPDMCRLFGFSLLLQVLAFVICVGFKGRSLAGFSTLQVAQRAVDIIVAAIPVGAPTVVICALGACTQKLRSKGIDFLNPSKLKIAADVSIVCFDKTGTLTGSMPELHGMVPMEGGQFGGLQRMAMRWPNRLKQAAAVCNSLTLINRKQVVGDAADKQAFKAVEAQFVERNVVSLPLRPKSGTPASSTKLQVLKRFDFESRLMRSGVVATDSSGHHTKTLLFVRGAPTQIEQLIRGGVLPPDYQKVIVEYATQSFRLLALAVGELEHVTSEELVGMTQQDAEAKAGHMDLLGLLVLSNGLQAVSKDTIVHLQEKGGIRTMMVTGDYHHTAIAIARGVSMIPEGGQVVIIQAKKQRRQVLPRSPSQLPPSALKTSKSLADAPSLARRSVSFAHETAPPVGSLSGAGPSAEDLQGVTFQLARKCYEGLTFTLDSGNDLEDWAPQYALTNIAQGSAQCCVTGPALEHMLQQADSSVLETVMANVSVFARMRSQQKGQVMDLLGSRGLHQNLDGLQRHIPGLGKTCMYCGDGINDLMALAAADVGMAIGSGHASAAASVSDKHSSVAGVVTVLCKARSSHMIKLAALKYMVLYELLLSVAVDCMFLLDGSKFSVVQRTTLDFMAITLGVVASLRPAAAELAPARPPQKISTYKNFVLLVGTMTVSAMSYWAALTFLYHQPWFAGSTADSEQNPVLSTVWAGSLWHILLPVLSFAADVGAFCEPFSKPEGLLFAVYGVFSFLCVFLGPSWFDVANLFKFYHFKFSYTYKLDIFGWGFVVMFLVVLKLIRKLWERYDQNLARVSPLNI